MIEDRASAWRRAGYLMNRRAAIGLRDQLRERRAATMTALFLQR